MKRVLGLIMHSKAATIVAALLCISMWWLSLDSQPSLLPSGIAAIAYSALGIYLMRINKRTAFNIPCNSPLAGTLFLMGCVLVPQMATSLMPMTQLILLASACSLLLHTYRVNDAMGSYFIAFVLVGAASLISPTLLFVAPLLLVCCPLLKSLHIRTILASLLGLLLPYWVIVCVLFLTDTPIPVDTFVEGLLSPTSSAPHKDLLLVNGYKLSFAAIQMLWLLLLTIPSIIATFFSRSILKARTQSSLYFLTTTMLLALVFIAIFPALYTTMIPLLLLANAISGSAFFVDRNNMGSRIYFLIMMIVWLLMIALSVWNIFTTY